MALSSTDADYDELVDAAEDIGNILSALAAGALDLGPITQSWLLDELEDVERALAARLDEHEQPGVNGEVVHTAKPSAHAE